MPFCSVCSDCLTSAHNRLVRKMLVRFSKSRLSWLHLRRVWQVADRTRVHCAAVRLLCQASALKYSCLGVTSGSVPHQLESKTKFSWCEKTAAIFSENCRSPDATPRMVPFRSPQLPGYAAQMPGKWTALKQGMLVVPIH